MCDCHQISHRVIAHFVVVALHDERSEGLSRGMVLQMIQKASGFTLTLSQAAHTWDRTIHPYGRKIGLLTGYVKPQEGTSKRTAAGDPALQKKWYDNVTDGLKEVERIALEVLKDPDLVTKMMPFLVANLDEESLQGQGKNYKVVGGKSVTKHDCENGSSRSLLSFFFCVGK